MRGNTVSSLPSASSTALVNAPFCQRVSSREVCEALAEMGTVTLAAAQRLPEHSRGDLLRTAGERRAAPRPSRSWRVQNIIRLSDVCGDLGHRDRRRPHLEVGGRREAHPAANPTDEPVHVGAGTDAADQQAGEQRAGPVLRNQGLRSPTVSTRSRRFWWTTLLVQTNGLASSL